jgi:hypothetical protein
MKHKIIPTMLIKIILKYSNKCSFNKPADKRDIEKCEKILGIELPKQLTDLLLESNGIHGEYGLRLIWTVDEIAETNREFRTNSDFKRIYRPFDNILFFADAGNGDQFGFSITNGQIKTTDVFVWNHEDDSREWVATDMLKYLEGWLSGQLKI